MQFSTTNTPADYQGYIINTIREALENFASVYLNDILMYSDFDEEHVEHVQWIMQCLMDSGVYLKLEQCEFEKERIRCPGSIISTRGISQDEHTVETVRNWSREQKTRNGGLNNLFKVQQFLRVCNYYKQFIRMYSEKQNYWQCWWRVTNHPSGCNGRGRTQVMWMLLDWTRSAYRGTRIKIDSKVGLLFAIQENE